MAIVDYSGNIPWARRRYRREEVRFGLQPRDLPRTRAGSTMKPIGAYALALDYKLINYSSQIPDSRTTRRRTRRSLKDQYIGVMESLPRRRSPAAMWRARPTQLRRCRRSGQPDARLRRIAAVLPQPRWLSGSAIWSVWTTCITLSMTRWNAAISNAENDMDLGPLVLGSPEQRPDCGAAGRCVHDVQHRYIHDTALLYRDHRLPEGNMIWTTTSISTRPGPSARTRRTS